MVIKERWDRRGAPGSGYSSHLDPGSQPGAVLPLEEFDNVWRHFCVIETRGESRECYWHLEDRDQDADKHPTTHRTATHNKELPGLGTGCDCLPFSFLLCCQFGPSLCISSGYHTGSWEKGVRHSQPATLILAVTLSLTLTSIVPRLKTPISENGPL